ncbi:acyltransferase family protein [Sphingomonas sp. G-3-2-10]|uniref:acyltransferase family protein n=1 Tax=Sphingomonas sp. G-3-2-10 TaxID=2728838 RepID=UPI00146D6FA1|nr:acyltransferase family protein [Sphingomonas sp. G-3-2-10]NML06996.1 acyltransferase family protein [Sphingomonas sp. G-3-2-10]
MHPSGASSSSTPSQRHYGLDWLRIAAFALLILYHIGMAFAPWQWVIHTAYHFPGLIGPMALLTPWRLPLLFAVSGYASRALFDKSGSAGPFARSRVRRLLIPLGFGMVVLVPLEMWVLVMEGGYTGSYLHFWTSDYWRWGEFHGREFPSWEHLWFVAYLAAYTFLLAGALAWRGERVFALFDKAAAWLATGNRILWAPALALVAMKLALLFVVPERQGLFRDWSGHAQYLPIFLAGFVLGGTLSLWPAIARVWKPALLLAAVAGAIDVAMELNYPGATPIGHGAMAIDRAARIAMGWFMIVALFHIAQTWWNRDHPWRATLAEAVFPFYLIHHPVIVLLAWYSLPLKLSAGAEFVLLFTGTAAACLAFYLIGRDIGWLRPFIGLSSKPLAKPAAAAQLGPAG